MADEYECKPLSEVTEEEQAEYRRLNDIRFPKRYCCEECPGDDSCEHNEICMCGGYMDKHSMYDGHGPVSMHHYYGEERK